MTRGMLKILACAALVLVSLPALTACSKSRSPSVGGETNWLLRCSDDDACEMGSCLCGVCTRSCSEAERCTGDFEGTCADTDEGAGAALACGSNAPAAPAVCLPRCSSDDACGDGYLCDEAVCIPRPLADAGPPDGGNPAPSLDQTSWNAEVSAPGTGIFVCTRMAALTLHFVGAQSGLTAIVGDSGRALQGSFSRTALGWSLQEPIVISEDSLCEKSILALVIVPVDDDGDGDVDALTGTGSWQDTNEAQIADFALTAMPDDVAPTVTLFVAALSPLGITVAAPEPLQAGASLTLQGDPTVELEPESTADGVVVGFRSSRVLPFGGTWRAVGSGLDLAGLPLAVTGELRTASDPGILAQDGFEGSVPAAYGTVTNAAGVAIDGSSLLVSRSALHLARAAGQTTLHYALRLLSRAALEPASHLISDSPVVIRYGLIGGAARETQVQLDDELVETGDSQSPFATAVHSGSVTLDADELGELGEDVLIDIAQGCVGPRFESQGCANETALVLDDLRLE